jgi:AcrR family transcriptional regulator
MTISNLAITVGRRKDAPQAAPVLGLREQNKIDKLRRIKAAAAELFTKKGFEATTTIEIAKLAGVAEGTLFLYAKDKRDLLFQIRLEELDETRDKGFAKIDPKTPLLEQLIVPEAMMYRHVAKNIRLERIFFEEISFCSGEQAAGIQENRARAIARVQKVLLRAELTGLIRCDEDLAFVARHMFYSSMGAMRWWIAEPKPKLSNGIADVRRVYALHLRALNPHPSVFGSLTTLGRGRRGR